MFPVQFSDQRVEAFFEISAVPKILYQALLESNNYSFVVMDRDYRLQPILTGDEELASMHMEEPCYKLVHNYDHPCKDCPVTVLFEEGKLATVKKCLSLPGESKTWCYEIRAYPLFDKQYNVIYAITAFRCVECEKTDSGTPANEIKHLSMKLSNREVEVLRLMADGKTNSEIATILSISPNTVKCHTIHIFNKLGVTNRTQASVLLVIE